MKTNEKGFLGSFVNDFKVGDLVTWSEFERDENFVYSSITRNGAIIKIRTRNMPYNDRYVWIADVLPFGETQTKEVYLNILRKGTN